MTTQQQKPYVIGLDLGGTNSVFGIVDQRGEIKATTAIKTQGYDKVEDYVAASVDALQIIIDQVGGIETIKAMGIGAPNGNYYNGTIEYAPNLPWAHDTVVPLAKLFSDALGGIPVALTNDGNAAAVDQNLGAGRTTCRAPSADYPQPAPALLHLCDTGPVGGAERHRQPGPLR